MPPRAPRLATRFDEVAWEEDLTRTTEAGRTAAAKARRDYERQGGVPLSQLRRVDEHGQDGTVLPRCAKVYVPAPAGRFGIVFKLEIEQDRGMVLNFLAFGVRHHPARSRRPTVYELAHWRMHGRHLDAEPPGGGAHGREGYEGQETWAALGERAVIGVDSA